MKNKIAILIILIFVFLVAGLNLKVIAQGAPGENTAAPAAEEPPVQESPAQETPVSANAPTLQRSAKSNVSCVKVGSVSDEEKPAICNQTSTVNPLTSNSEGLAKILEWDELIVSNLQTGLWGYFNKLLTNLTNGEYSTGTWAGTNEGNLYWCTDSIIDAYRLAGIGGLDRNIGHRAVVNMRKFWKTASGYQYVDYESNNQNLVNVRPGYAMFMESEAGVFTKREHVNMVKEISVDSTGDGYFITNDSNSSSKGKRYTVEGWRVLNTIYPVRGFGGI